MHSRKDRTSPGGAPSMNADTAAALPVAILWTSDTASIGGFISRLWRGRVGCVDSRSGKRESACDSQMRNLLLWILDSNNKYLSSDV